MPTSGQRQNEGHAFSMQIEHGGRDFHSFFDISKPTFCPQSVRA